MILITALRRAANLSVETELETLHLGSLNYQW